MTVDEFDGLDKLALTVRLAEAADRHRRGAGIFMAGCEQGWNVPRLRVSREIDPGLLTAQPHVAEDEMDLFAVDHSQRLIEVVDRRDDLIARVLQDVFVVERGQRL